MVKENYLGKNAAFLRKGYLGIPQKEMSERLGMSCEQYSRIEHGRYKQLTIDNILNIADVFNIDLENLIRVDIQQKVSNVIGPYLKKTLSDSKAP